MRRWLPWVLALLMLVVLAGGSYTIGQRHVTDAIGPCPKDKGMSGAAKYNASIGQRVLHSYPTLLCSRGTALIQLLDAELVDVDPGMVVHAVYAASLWEFNWLVVDAPEGGSEKLRPITDAIIVPTDEEQHWHVVVEVSVDRPGFFCARGLQITYRVGDKRGTHTYFDQPKAIDTGDSDKDPLQDCVRDAG